MAFVFPPDPVPCVGIEGHSELFPVHRIYCVGRNYADHVKEMGGDPKSEPPVFFSKPADAIVINNDAVPYPPATQELHHEVELVIALGSGGQNIDQREALHCVFGYAVGVDLTCRDLQALAKDAGRPWDVAKGFDRSAPISQISLVADVGHPDSGEISLAVNGDTKQQGDLSDMIWSVPEIICALSGYFELKPGDLIFTGTPAGVSAVNKGDKLVAKINQLGSVELELV